MNNRGDIIAGLFMVRRWPEGLRQRAAARKHRKQMRSAARFSVADIPENQFGKLVGLVRPCNKKLLEAPLSGRLCVYYEVYVDAMRGQTLMRTIASEQEGIRFLVEDGNARALVDPANAFMSTGIDRVEQSTLFLVTDRQESLLARHKLFGKQLPFADGLRFREAILECDEKIAVYGGGVRERDPDVTPGEYRDGQATRLCLSGSDRFPLFISDDPKATT